MTTDDTARNKQLVDTFIQELFSKGDLDAVDRYLDPDFVHHDPPVPGAPDGPEGFRYAAAMVRRACPDWHSELHQLVGFTAGGTHRAELLGVAATGNTLTLPGINIFRVRGDMIVERWGCVDLAGLMHQLGLIPG
ncbi:ester cyclase [Pseudonocardia adelaidensis]